MRLQAVEHCLIKVLRLYDGVASLNACKDVMTAGERDSLMAFYEMCLVPRIHEVVPPTTQSDA